jgi:FtsZ-binding cell division protein ZapB
MHLQGKADEAAGVLVEVAEPPLLEEPPGAVEAEEPVAPETGTGVAVTVGQLQMQVCQQEDQIRVLQAEINGLRSDVTTLAREEFDRLLAEIIQEEAEEMQQENSVEPAAAPKRRHSAWWAG